MKVLWVSGLSLRPSLRIGLGFRFGGVHVQVSELLLLLPACMYMYACMQACTHGMHMCCVYVAYMHTYIHTCIHPYRTMHSNPESIFLSTCARTMRAIEILVKG